MIILLSRIVLIAVALLCLGESVMAQTYNPFNQRDDTYRLLGLKRAKQAYDAAQAEYERQQKLYDKGLITRLDLERTRNVYTDAEVNYQQSLLAVLFEEQYVTISKAVKYRAKDGSKRVRLTVANASGGSAEFHKLINVDDALFRSLQPDIVNNVYVSILNEENAIISHPYESKIDQLTHGNPATLDFAMLQDLDEVTVAITYGNGSRRTMKIFLQKDATVDRVVVESEQFSQEVELGKSSSFDLTLELFSGTSNTFSLEVVNLPEQIGRFFKDPSGSVRLSQVRFAESARTKRAALEVSLPDRPSDDVALDVPIPFYVLVIPREKMVESDDLHSRFWTQQEIEELGVGFVRLELLPCGVGELLARLPQMYHSIDADGIAEMSLEVVNEGSHRINDIEVRLDLPLNWTKSIQPALVRSLDIGGDALIRLEITPSDDVAPGKYEVRVRTSGMSNGRPISAKDKTVTIEIRSESNVWGTILIIVVLLGLVGGIVIYGTHLSRK